MLTERNAVRQVVGTHKGRGFVAEFPPNLENSCITRYRDCERGRDNVIAILPL